MAVPGASANYLKNTTGGTYTATKEGGTLLANTTTGDVITKALALKDNATDFGRSPLPIETANGLVANQKVLSGGTFAYDVAGKYVIAASSSELSGVASTKVLITGAGENQPPIAKFQHSFGAKTVSAIRANRFSWTGTKSRNTAGASLGSRINWVAAASGGADSASAPDALNEFMYDISDGNASNLAFDSAAEPTRSIPGELVMKVDFVTLTVASGGDFFDYKPITGM
tara:strand:- start:2687 stop:3373 length:687 start_codon:yes stop_codon:yes gene_type:complete